MTVPVAGAASAAVKVIFLRSERGEALRAGVRDRLFHIFGAASLAALFICSIPGKSGAVTSGFPFGLEGLHWGMSLDQATARYPAIGPKGNPRLLPPDSSDKAGPVLWKDCTLALEFYFTDGHLVHVSIHASRLTPDCANEMKQDLNAHYGKGDQKENFATVTHARMGETVRWETPETRAVYNSIESPPTRANSKHEFDSASVEIIEPDAAPLHYLPVRPLPIIEPDGRWRRRAPFLPVRPVPVPAAHE